MVARNLIITGMPRGGTTLLAALIDSSPGVLCLSEPKLPKAKAGLSNSTFVEGLVVDFEDFRTRVARGDTVQDRRKPHGERLTNYLSPADASGNRAQIWQWSVFRRPDLPGDFTLGVKQNGHFLGALEELSRNDYFECVGLIRHPRDTFASWVSTPFTVNAGRLPNAEKRRQLMADIGRSDALSVPERMAHIYEAIVRRLALTPVSALLRYEDIVNDPSSLFRMLRLEAGDVALVAPQPAPVENAVVASALDALAICGDVAKQLYSW